MPEAFFYQLNVDPPESVLPRLLDMALASTQSIQERNSVVTSRHALRIIDFDQAHAAAV